jgi:hypothetical protein
MDHGGGTPTVAAPWLSCTNHRSLALSSDLRYSIHRRTRWGLPYRRLCHDDHHPRSRAVHGGVVCSGERFRLHSLPYSHRRNTPTTAAPWHTRPIASPRHGNPAARYRWSQQWQTRRCFSISFSRTPPSAMAPLLHAMTGPLDLDRKRSAGRIYI